MKYNNNNVALLGLNTKGTEFYKSASICQYNIKSINETWLKYELNIQCNFSWRVNSVKKLESVLLALD